ncbi:HlyD family secretion protein [Brasilonema octagenarum UFV-E1]|uniref:HlyD family secretion protein n=1 Tax=Brasilonema sennae CENA114 TaxID=415709 RepID=A0A856M910_9CYAN|nr:HlyD family efflux transporter periplasmic adaptor subunit [Brasilonema sennae]QDL07675.1 HlyD family secretion protein [Brasilonema sennae CENA114]QDL14037.1 HlyD family secretion protein [Brasilonema octagenarum UFV-E1]
MPNTSRDPSSGVPPQSDPQKNYIPSAKSAESTELSKHTEATDDTQNWFSGTEELLDALPKVWTRSSLYLLTAFALIVLPWAMFSKVDETESARGRLEPKGATQKLDSPVGGSVTAVKVKEGETVKAGQVLLELDSQVVKTELNQVQTKLDGLQNRRKSSELLKNQLTLSVRTQQQQNQAQLLAKQSQVDQARRNLDTLKSVYNLQKEEKLAKVAQVQQALDSSKSAYKLAEVRLQASQEKVPRYKKAYQDGVMPQERFEEIQQSAKENYEYLLRAKSDIAQTQSSLKEQQSSYQRTIQQAQSEIQQAQLKAEEEQRNYQSLVHTGELAQLKAEEQLKELQAQIDSVQSEISQTQSQLTASNIQLQQRVVRSPIDGVIFEFPTTKPGAVLQPGQRVAQIAPLQVGVVLKAVIPNQHSGFLKAGMPAKVKFDAYPFQEYGIVSAKVNWISPDSKVTQTPQGNVENFELEITLDKQYIENGNKRLQFIPGQTATAEVVIRQRRIIDFILDPFKKLHKGGLNV